MSRILAALKTFFRMTKSGLNYKSSIVVFVIIGILMISGIYGTQEEMLLLDNLKIIFENN